MNADNEASLDNDRDLKTELRNILALHTATSELEHGVRRILSVETYVTFAPSRFVYAFFTFNCIFSFNWQKSFDRQRACQWNENETGNEEQANEVCPSCKRKKSEADSNPPREKDQFKAYLKFLKDVLGVQAPQLFADAFRSVLAPSGLNPVEELKHIKVQNAPKSLKNAKDQLHKVVSRLYQPTSGNTTPEIFYTDMCYVVNFIYEVRCNMFHGRKTLVDLQQDEAQQHRLEVLSALIIATNSLLFKAADKFKIGWENVEFKFPQATEQSGAVDNLTTILLA